MNELETNDQERDRKRRSIRVRSMRRGMRELDILIGGFVEERLESLSDEELDNLLALLFETDVAVLDWIVGASECPERYLGPRRGDQGGRRGTRIQSLNPSVALGLEQLARGDAGHRKSDIVVPLSLPWQRAMHSHRDTIEILRECLDFLKKSC